MKRERTRGFKDIEDIESSKPLSLATKNPIDQFVRAGYAGMEIGGIMKETAAKPSDLVKFGSEKPLSRKQREAIPHLLGARSYEAGCKKAGLSKGTFYRWLKEEAFKTALERQREEIIKESLQRLKFAITKSVDGLTELVESEEKGIRLRACEKIVDFFFKVKEVEELEGRLEKIERIILERRSYRE